MGKTIWTKEQLSAIETRNSNLLIAAAAGSGKTAVLVERIIRIITDEENPIDIDKLLVVTFTSSDASSISKALANSLNKFPSPLYSVSNETLLLSTVTD